MGKSNDGVQRRTVLKALAVAPVAAAVTTAAIRPQQAAAVTVPDQDPVVPVPAPRRSHLIGVL
jgi:hypothetical protein